MTVPNVPAAPLIDRLLCRHCGTSLVAYRRCLCLPANPDAVLAEVKSRHRASVQLACRHDTARRRSPAWSNQ